MKYTTVYRISKKFSYQSKLAFSNFKKKRSYFVGQHLKQILVLVICTTVQCDAIRSEQLLRRCRLGQL